MKKLILLVVLIVLLMSCQSQAPQPNVSSAPTNTLILQTTTNTPKPTSTSLPPTPTVTPPPPTMLPLQENSLYGIPHDSPEWQIIPIGLLDNKTPFNILVLGTDMNCTLTINVKTDFTGLSKQSDKIVLGSHTWNILRTYQENKQIDEIYYPDIYPQEYREGGGVDGNGYSVTGFYDSCRLPIQSILGRMP